MRVWALDLAGITGWCIGFDKHIINSGTWDTRPRRGDSIGMRYIYLEQKLNNLKANGLPDVIAYEQAHHRGGAATQIALGMVATVHAWCAKHGIAHTAIHSATIKKRATGNGRASKEDMKRYASLLLAEHCPRIPGPIGTEPLGIEDDNEADAICLCCVVMELV